MKQTEQIDLTLWEVIKITLKVTVTLVTAYIFAKVITTMFIAFLLTISAAPATASVTLPLVIWIIGVSLLTLLIVDLVRNSFRIIIRDAAKFSDWYARAINALDTDYAKYVGHDSSLEARKEKMVRSLDWSNRRYRQLRSHHDDLGKYNPDGTFDHTAKYSPHEEKVYISIGDKMVKVWEDQKQADLPRKIKELASVIEANKLSNTPMVKVLGWVRLRS